MVEGQVKEKGVVAVKPRDIGACFHCSRAVYLGGDYKVQWKGNEKGKDDWNHRRGQTRKGCGIPE